MTTPSKRPRSRPLTAYDRRCLREAIAETLRDNPPPQRPDNPLPDGMPPPSQLYSPRSRAQLADPFISGD
jgi:hypothetical protein